jgi:hypothetical protein
LRQALISPAPRQFAGRTVIMFTGLDQIEQLEFALSSPSGIDPSALHRTS